MKPRALLISDVPGWAFDTNMRDMVEYLSGSFDFEHFYVIDWHKGVCPAWDEYDVLFECYQRNPNMGLPYSRTIGALRCQWFKPERPANPDDADVALVNRYAAFQMALKSSYDALGNRCPNAVYLPNPINMRRFPLLTPPRDKIVAEWNGNAEHKTFDGRRIKHYRDIVVPACQRAGVTLHSAEYNTQNGDSRRRAPAEMPEFYLQANVALCASEYEAVSNSVLESMASGLAVIATDVGNHREMCDTQMAEYGDSGILLVDGTVDAFVAALGALTPARAREMGAINRAEIEARWSWDVWAPRYAEVLRKVVRRPKAVIAKLPVAPPAVSETSLPATIAVAIPVDFSYWNGVDPASFLADDWGNPSRTWAGRAVEAAVARGCKTMVEAGPGVGVDYERQFKQIAVDGRLAYTGFEGSSGLCSHLRAKFPEATWQNKPLTDLPPRAFDIAYERAVLEHQPALEPSLSRLLGTAEKLVVLIWYRPPAPKAVGEKVDGVYYQTFCRAEVLDVVARAGWKLTQEIAFDGGNHGWLLERI